MLNKILLAIILGVFAGLTHAGAQTAPTAPARVKGTIVVARAQGHVTAVSKADGTTRVLHDGDRVSDQTTVVTAPGANVILAFSNGATVNVAADSSLDIEQFEQDPFATDIKISELKQEPSTSTTRLSLTRGELVGKVVHLNIDRGSEFTVQTPVGAAGIRGTTFRIVFRPDPATGKAFFVVTTADGTVVFRGVTSNPVNIPAGKQVVATFEYTAPTPGSTTPPAAPTTPVTIVTTDVSPTEAAQIQTASQAIVSAVSTTVIPSSGTGGNGGTGGTGGNGNNGNNGNNGDTNNNTPPPPTQQPAQTTPGAGSGA